MTVAELAEINAYLHHHVPLARAMKVSIGCFDVAGVTLNAPLAPNVNDKGTAFGGALAAILSLSGWALCYLLLAQQGEAADLVIVASHLEYRQPVREDIVAVCELPESAVVARFLDNYRRRGKATLTLAATVQAAGSTAVAFQGRYAAIRTG